MNKKTFTFIVTSNRQGRSKHITISHAWVKAAAALGFIGVVLLGSVIVDYFGLMLAWTEMKDLRVEKDHLKQKFEVVENKIEYLENRLERVKKF